MSHFVSTLDLLSAVVARCQALELSAGVKLFADVKVFPNADLVEALRKLQVHSKRACFVIPSADSFENARAGRDLESECTRSFVMLITDQTVAGANAATTGDGTNPGVLVMKDAVIEALLGENFEFAPKLVRLRPTEAFALTISSEDQKKIPGRQAWQITWEADCGKTSVSVSL